MAKYQCSSLGRYAEMLTEDIVHAVVGEFRTPEGEWEEDPNQDPVDVAYGSARELSYHLMKMTASANALEKLSGLEVGENLKLHDYVSEQMNQERGLYSTGFAWLTDDDEDGDTD